MLCRTALTRTRVTSRKEIILPQRRESIKKRTDIVKQICESYFSESKKECQPFQFKPARADWSVTYSTHNNPSITAKVIKR